MLLEGMDELGVSNDLVYLVVRAVATHVGLLKYVVEVGSLINAVDDVAEDLLLALGTGSSLTTKLQPFPEGALFRDVNYLLLRRLRG